jgi:hypothetical protein
MKKKKVRKLKARPVCWICAKGIEGEPFIHRGLTGKDYRMCGYCHMMNCAGCVQCERSD